MAVDGEFIDGILDKYKYLYIPRNKLKDSGHKLGLLKDFYFRRDRKNGKGCTPYILNTAAECRYKSRGKLD